MKLGTALIVLIGTAVTSTQAFFNLDARAGQHPMGRFFAVKNVHQTGCAVREHGCENGYCWRKCDRDGAWCWMALNRGYGDWVRCLKDEECGPAPFRDASCSICDKKVCGCSC